MMKFNSLKIIAKSLGGGCPSPRPLPKIAAKTGAYARPLGARCGGRLRRSRANVLVFNGAFLP